MSSHNKGAPIRELGNHASVVLNPSQDTTSRTVNRDGPAQKDLLHSLDSSLYDYKNGKNTNDTEANPLAGSKEVNKQEVVEILKSSSFLAQDPERESPTLAQISPQHDFEKELNIAIVAACDAVEQAEKSRKECEELRREVNELSGLLQDARDFIFRIQPYQQNITEAVAAAEYTALCESVQSWIEFRLGDDIYDHSMLKESSFQARQAIEFLKLVSSVGRERFSCQDTDQPNVVAAVMQFLIQEIFGKDFYCPIEPGAVEFLHTVEQSMGTLTPHRDIAAIRSWRSETLNAIINRSTFKDHRAEYAKQLTTSLARMLRIFKPRTEMKEFQSSIRDSIIKPAIELAEQLQLSVDKFEITWTPHSQGLTGDRADSMPDLQQYECVNTQGKTIKFPKDQASTGREDIVYLLDICPGLSCRNVKSDVWSAAKVLRKPKVLVAMTKPNGHLVKQGSSDNADVTLLGTLDRRLNAKRN